MKNLYKSIVAKSFLFLILLIVLNFEKSFSQETVLWANATTNNVSITGNTNSGVVVTASTSGLNGNYFLQATPPNSIFFQGRGPWPATTTNAADDLIFTFSRPVIITNFILTDVNTSTGSTSWNDSFTIFNAGFTASVPNNANVSPTGVQLTQGINNVNNPSFLCSNPIQNFEVHFALINSNITTAWLNYRIDLIAIPIIDPICVNSNFDLNGIVVGNNVQGTWNPPTVDTSVSGDFVYTFIPNAGQSIACQVPVTITVLPINDPNCCAGQINLVSPTNDMSNITIPVTTIRRQASDWIRASNVIGIGNNAFQNGVIYHAENYVDLVPGFDAVNNSQFVAYIEGCTDNYTYRNQNSVAHQIIEKDENRNLATNSSSFSIIPNPSSNSIEIVGSNNQLDKIEIVSIDGRKVFETLIDTNNKVQVDVSNYKNGVYIVIATDNIGQQFSQKLIKN